MRARPALHAVLLVALTAACGNPGAPDQVSDDPNDPGAPRYPGSEAIPAPFEKSNEPYCGGGLDNCCSVTITARGTDDPIEEVVSFYEELGFEGPRVLFDPETGEEDPEGELLRWKADREGDPVSHRHADIGIGLVFAQPQWETVIEIHAPRCGPRPGPSTTSIG